MSLKQKILDDTKEAMKAKDMAKVNTLRFLTAAVKNKEIDVRPNTITDEDVMSVIRKSVKQRQDSIEQYNKGGRPDLVEKEQQELAIIETYLPKAMSADQLTAIVNAVIAETGAKSIKDMGTVMKAVQAKTQGAADNKLVSEVIKKTLQG